MPFTPIPSGDIQVDKPGKQSIFQAYKDNDDYFNSLIGTLEGVDIINGSFEVDSESDGIPDTWTRNLYSGGTQTIVAANADYGHGAVGVNFTQPVGASQGGGELLSDFLPFQQTMGLKVGFACVSVTSAMVNQVQVLHYGATKLPTLTNPVVTIFDTSGSDVADGYKVVFHQVAPGTMFIRIKVIGGAVGPNLGTPGDCYFDNVTIRPQFAWNFSRTLAITEGSTAATSWTTVGSTTLNLPHSITKTTVGLTAVVNARIQSGSGEGQVRLQIGSATSLEPYFLVDTDEHPTLLLEFDPAGSTSLTLNLQVKMTTSTGVAGLPSGPAWLHIQDPIT